MGYSYLKLADITAFRHLIVRPKPLDIIIQQKRFFVKLSKTTKVPLKCEIRGIKKGIGIKLPIPKNNPSVDV